LVTPRLELIRIAAVALALLGPASQARAQIYTWQDADGHLVLSDRRPAAKADVRAYPVLRSDRVLATRFVSREKSAPYEDLIVEQARLNNVRTDLVRAVMQVESGFNPYARSPKGAVGLMQLMPGTIRQFGVGNPFAPRENVRAGVAYLRQLLDRYDNSETLALAAYNAGPGAVDRHGQAIPPYQETKDYVSRVHRISGQDRQVPGTHIYKVVEVIDGREVARYTDRKP
jgi:soluble lytic murein transglycosylase-like protein